MTDEKVKQKLRICQLEKENRQLRLEMTRYTHALEDSERISVGLYCALYPTIESFDIRDLNDYGRGFSPFDFVAGKHDDEILRREEQDIYGVSPRPEEEPFALEEAGIRSGIFHKIHKNNE